MKERQKINKDKLKVKLLDQLQEDKYPFFRR